MELGNACCPKRVKKAILSHISWIARSASAPLKRNIMFYLTK